MGFWSFLLLVILILAGVMLYHRLQDMEREIRAELEKALENQQVKAQAPQPSLPESMQRAGMVGSESTGIESQLLEAVDVDPGILQTALYKKIPGQSAKTLQDMLRKMDQDGKVRRVKAKGSYKVFPA